MTYQSGPLGEAGMQVWEHVTRAYDLSPGELELLSQVCQVVDQIAYLDALLVEQPLIVKGSMGQMRVHPLLPALGEQRRLLASLLAQLDLPMPDEAMDDLARWRARREHGNG